jgi:hypothetical protein
MTNNKILKITLEEYGYKLKDIIFPSEGLEMAITEAMDRARYDHAEKVVKEIERRSLKIGFFDADSERATNIIRKIK